MITATAKVDTRIELTVIFTSTDETRDLYDVVTQSRGLLRHWPTNQAKDFVAKLGEAARVSKEEISDYLEGWK